ncbi:MAG: hypothetical protein IBJ09_03775 [Bacteroidia bacterium]|nr:hypothetical protein [Bacteroidia bacterium]
MKKLLPLLFILLAAPGAQAQNPVTYPTYKEIVTHFFSRYMLTEGVSGPATVFEKRPTGWWVRLQDELYTEVAYYQLWKSEDGSYPPVDLLPAKGTRANQSAVDVLLNDTYRNAYYALEPYYGYTGWTEDVIRTFGNRNDLTDTLLYGLGNACSLYASDLLTNNSGLSDPEKMFRPDERTGLISAAELAVYREYRHKAIELLEQLSRRNPDFQTLVGPIRLKYWNEVVVAFWDVWEYYGEEEARKELKPDLYNAFYLDLAANQLESCPKNAILFSAGDTDTFPLLYMQVQKGFRPDVRLVNMNLYQIPHYANALRRPFFGAEPLPFGMSPEETADPRFEYVLLENSEEPLAVTDIPGHLEARYPAAYRHNFRFTFPSSSFSYNDHLTLKAGAGYLLRNDLLFLNLLRVNKEQRPVCFTLSHSDYMQAGDNMSITGLVLQLQYDKRYYYEAKDAEAVYDLLMKRLRTSPGIRLQASETRLVFPYTFGFMYLARTLADKGDKVRTEQLLDRYFSLFGEVLPASDPWNLYLVELYYRADAFAKGNALAARMVPGLEYSADRMDQATLTNLRELMEKYKQPAIIAKDRK